MISVLSFIVSTFRIISTNQVQNAISPFAVITCLTVCNSDFFIVIILKFVYSHLLLKFSDIFLKIRHSTQKC